MTTSTTSIDIIGRQAAYYTLHTDDERDYCIHPYYDAISSSGGKTSYDADNRPFIVMRSNLWASGDDVDLTVHFSSRRRHASVDRDWSSYVCSFFLKQKTAY